MQCRTILNKLVVLYFDQYQHAIEHCYVLILCRCFECVTRVAVIIMGYCFYDA